MSSSGQQASAKPTPSGRSSSNKVVRKQAAQPTRRKQVHEQSTRSRRTRTDDGFVAWEQPQHRRGDEQETTSFRKALKFPKYELPAVEPGSADYEGSKKAKKQAMLQQLEGQYGPHFSDSDVRLYLKQREFNAASIKQSRRGGIPLDDSFDRPETFLKLSLEFQRTILNERCAALLAALPALSWSAAWQLYTTIPGLLTFMTMQVAQRLHGLSRATGLTPEQLVPHLVAFRRLAFLHPGTAESRVGLLARVAKLSRQQAVVLMMQHPQLWLMDSRSLGPRAEQLALLLCCCTVTALKLIASCPQLLTVQLQGVQWQLSALCNLFSSVGSDSVPASPAMVLPLLLCQPGLLLPAGSEQTATGIDNQQLQHQHSGYGQQQVCLPEARTSMLPVSIVQQQLRALSDALQLPNTLVQYAVLQAPDLLQLPDRSVVAAAAQALAHSFLCSEGATATRQQYQQHLLQLLQQADKRKQQARHKHREQQQWQQPQLLRFVAAAALSRTAESCQWWSSSSSFNKPDAMGLPALQQLLVQAPSLLLLAAGAATSSPSISAAGAGQTVVQPVLMDGVEARLHSLCQQLLLALAEQEHGTLQQHKEGKQQQPGSISSAVLLEQLRSVAVKEPCILAQPHSFVVGQLQQLSKGLGISPVQCWRLVIECPACLWLTDAQVYDRIRVLGGVLKLPAADIRAKLAESETVPVLLLEPSQVKQLGAAVATRAAAGKTAGTALQQLRNQLMLLLPGLQLDMQ